MEGEELGAGWYKDPAGRARLRYWNGARWSEWVSNRGDVERDAIPTVVSGGSGCLGLAVVLGDVALTLVLLAIVAGISTIGPSDMAGFGIGLLVFWALIAGAMAGVAALVGFHSSARVIAERCSSPPHRGSRRRPHHDRLARGSRSPPV